MILDKEEGYDVPEDLLSTALPNYRVILSVYWIGLEQLSGWVSNIEKKLSTHANVKRVCIGNIPLDEIAKNKDEQQWIRAMLVNSFHWYAIQATNFVRVIGWLIAKTKPDNDRNPTKYAIEYSDKVIPAVCVFRNKVAAHPSFVWPKDDNPADNTIAELSFVPTLYDDRFWVGKWKSVQTRKGEEAQSKHEMEWSLTMIHTRLEQRFGAKAG